MTATGVELPADFFPKISIFWLKRYGFLDKPTSGWCQNDNYKIQITTIIQDFHPYLYLVYVDSEGAASFKQKIDLVRTPCHYGGWRLWFQCPLPRNGLTCGGRHGVLYSNRGIFGCRVCHGMTYNCRQTNTHSFLQQYARAVKAERKLFAMDFKRRRLRYNGKPTKYSRQLRKLYKEVFVEEKDCIQGVFN